MTITLTHTAANARSPFGRLHRDTCKHIPAKAAETARPATEVEAEVLRQAGRATCCSVKDEHVEATIAAQGDAGRTDVVAAAEAIAAEAAAEAPVLTDEPGTITKLTGPNSVHSPGPAPKAKPAKAKAPTQVRVPRTFDPEGVDTHKCAGACGEEKPVRAFPTISGKKVRGVECRKCRDGRKVAKA